MKILKLEKSQIKPALELVWTVFQEFEATDYSQQGGFPIASNSLNAF